MPHHRRSRLAVRAGAARADVGAGADRTRPGRSRAKQSTRCYQIGSMVRVRSRCRRGPVADSDRALRPGHHVQERQHENRRRRGVDGEGDAEHPPRPDECKQRDRAGDEQHRAGEDQEHRETLGAIVLGLRRSLLGGSVADLGSVPGGGADLVGDARVDPGFRGPSEAWVVGDRVGTASRSRCGVAGIVGPDVRLGNGTGHRSLPFYNRYR